MSVAIATGVTTSLLTGAKTAELVSGQYQYIGKGRIQFLARASAAAATGIRATLAVAGVPLISDLLVPYAGTTGAMTNDHVVLDQVIAGGFVSLTFRNDSAATLTVDYMVLFTPM